MSRYGPRIAALERRAERDRVRLEDSDEEPQVEEPAAYLREGAGRAIWLYVEGRTGGRMVPFSAAELAALERAMNAWFECYALCHGIEIDAVFTIRDAAELLLETHNVIETAQLLLGVPKHNPSNGGGRYGPGGQ
ncbi:hypothetical protein [Natronobacterium gregoryi]|uniref:DUF8055 domain-containing protein n=2 Tax=Natronobacterium gregoryi TaxID=44930 RepID=L0ACJ4_NATGS|nr:hypothetical protein [Natronobacterium gregoryi]AFZ71603.1 hypothetical protein Natgr_0345 [Natronobacterium gregoryi SP2]ELY66658.1 hypothetical protein C490_12837 [Natronobacterium gregoryi SP2]PLK21370.1 hypothetical protein CYV19_04850 [Natronobacterium gregoryi SP2]SFI80701.1 hypothetical protein SAMN05443661_10640 [Natronobacterium gregoryi]